MSHKADSIMEQIKNLDIDEREDLLNQLKDNPDYELADYNDLLRIEEEIRCIRKDIRITSREKQNDNNK